jgi:ABC-type nitrate/sulfonate/bicarbonate transport system ATPase subunit
MAHGKRDARSSRSPGVDPLNLWGNAREGSEVATDLQARAQPPLRARAVRGGVALEDVSLTYPARNRRRGDGVHALAAVSLRAAPGELLAVVGPSGCGKSTLLELICGLRAPDTGSIECAPAVLMPQRDLLLPWLNALDNAGLALRIAGLSRAQARLRADALFAELGLDGFQLARPHELSGGMRQRVAFARTLLAGKPLLCLDEPFGALDAITRSEMQQWLAAALAREPRTVVLVTHDVEEAVLLADRVAVISRRPGRVVAELEVDIPRAGVDGRGRVATDTAVLAVRERALSALARGGRG